MEWNVWWLPGIGVAITAVIAFWSYIRSLWQHLAGRAIVTCEFRGKAVSLVQRYCWHKLKASPFGIRSFIGLDLYVRPLQQRTTVMAEHVGHSTRLFWQGWRPLWLSSMELSEKSRISLSAGCHEGGLRLSFIRGMFDPEQLAMAAAAAYRERQAEAEFRILHAFGTAQKTPGSEFQTNAASQVAGPSVSIPLEDCRVLGWREEDIGGCSSLDYGVCSLALSPEAQVLADEARRWRASAKWHAERGIPWRRGWLLYGKPGTGKTSLARAVAQDTDMPIFVFHLATMHDHELQQLWQLMLVTTPCVALIEDIDTMFHGRENKCGGRLTFECLLNCIDGIEGSAGVLLIITTNRLEEVDPALGIPVDGTCSRPGRIDRIVEMTPPDAEGRKKIAERILPESPVACAALVVAGEGETGAQFKERCARRALQHYWRGRKEPGARK